VGEGGKKGPSYRLRVEIAREDKREGKGTPIQTE